MGLKPKMNSRAEGRWITVSLGWSSVFSDFKWDGVAGEDSGQNFDTAPVPMAGLM